MPLWVRQSVRADNLATIADFTPSFNGQIVKIWYVVRILVKHSAWNEFGEGKAVDFPITILHKPRAI